VREYGFDADAPENQDELEKLRVHIDAIKPVWRTDLNAEWFELLDSNFKRLMHPYDSANPPSGEGWVIQLVCHHYNPYPDLKTDAGRIQMALPVSDPKRTDFGPYQFITEKVLNKLNSPTLRLFGVNHAALAWISEDREWTSEKGVQHNNLASNTVPLLDRAAPTAAATDGGGGMGSSPMAQAMGNRMAGDMGRMANMRQGMQGGGMGGGGPMSGMGMAGRGMMRMGGISPMTDAEAKKNLKTLTRTDFLLQFVWQPPKPDDQPKTEDEQSAKIKEIVDKMTEAQKNNPAVTLPKVEDLQAASLKKTQELDAKIQSAITPAAPGGAGGAPGPGTPGFSPQPAGAGTPPAGPGTPATKGASPPTQ
jgi:type IV pilus assembly protein PilM